MEYYLVNMAVAQDREMNIYIDYHWICKDLKTAIKCATHKAYVFDFKPLGNDELWEGVADIIKYYDKGYISIEKKQMWEKEGD